MALSDIFEALGYGIVGGYDGYLRGQAYKNEQEDRKRRDTQFRLGMEQEGYSYRPQSKAERKAEKDYGITPRTDRLGDYVRTGLSRDEATALAEATKETGKAVQRGQMRDDLVRMLGPIAGSPERARGMMDLYDYAPGMASSIASRMMPERERSQAPVFGSPEWEDAYRKQQAIRAEYAARGGRSGSGGGSGVGAFTPAELRQQQKLFLGRLVEETKGDYATIGKALYQNPNRLAEMQQLGIDSNDIAASVNEYTRRTAPRGRTSPTSANPIDEFMQTNASALSSIPSSASPAQIKKSLMEQYGMNATMADSVVARLRGR